MVIGLYAKNRIPTQKHLRDRLCNRMNNAKWSVNKRILSFDSPFSRYTDIERQLSVQSAIMSEISKSWVVQVQINNKRGKIAEDEDIESK